MTFDLDSATSSALAALKQGGQLRYPLLSNIHKGLKQGLIGVSDRWIVTLRESAPGAIRVSMRDIDTHRTEEISFEASSEAELKQRIVAWYDKIVWWSERLSVNRLEPNKQYVVLQDFKDYYSNEFKAGQPLTYVKQNFVPYHGGYTIYFEQATFYLHESDTVLNELDLYLGEV